MDVFRHFQSGGGIFASSTDAPGATLLTWFREASPARTSPPQAKAPASPESTPDCGVKWPESLAKYDRATSSWKTLPSSRRAASKSSWATWPAWGTMRAGACWARSTPEHLTNGYGCGYWPTPRTTGLDGGSNSRAAAKARGMWPTPRATEAGPDFAKLDRSATGISLQTAVQMFPTPRSEDSQCAGGHRGKDDTLYGMICRPKENFPTPTARDHKSPGLPEKRQARMNARAQPLTAVVGGQLNPDWVEWLMGWPIAWTDLKPLATARFREWRRWHGVF